MYSVVKWIRKFKSINKIICKSSSLASSLKVNLSVFSTAVSNKILIINNFVYVGLCVYSKEKWNRAAADEY